MRVVLDTNVLVAAMRSPRGASAHLLRAAQQRRLTPIISVALLFEYEAVLTRPEHCAVANVTPTDVHKALDAFLLIAEPVTGNWRLRPQLPDPDDDMVLEAAVNGDASAIITFEIRTFRAIATCLPIRVLTPAELCASLIP